MPCGRTWPNSVLWRRKGARGSRRCWGSVRVLAAQLQALQTMIGSIEKRIIAQHRASEQSKRVATIPGIGTLGASAITATLTDPSAFRSGRDFAAWIGLVP